MQWEMISQEFFIAYIVSPGVFQILLMSASVFKFIENWVDFGSLIPMQPSSGEDHKNENDDTALHLEEITATDTVNMEATSTQNAHPASQQRASEFGGPYGGLVPALEAAAKVHILSAEADRRVTSEYAKLSSPQEGSLNDKSTPCPANASIAQSLSHATSYFFAAMKRFKAFLSSHPPCFVFAFLIPPSLRLPGLLSLNTLQSPLKLQHDDVQSLVC